MTGGSVPWIALIVAIATFLVSTREFSRRAKVEYVSGLEKKLSDQDDMIAAQTLRLDECERDRQALHEENYKLMRRVLTLEERLT